MTSRPGQQAITIHILPNASRSKSSQTVKIGQVTERNNRNIFFKNQAENEAGRLVSRLFCFSKKIYMSKSKWSAA